MDEAKIFFKNLIAGGYINGKTRKVSSESTMVPVVAICLLLEAYERVLRFPVVRWIGVGS